MTSIGHGIYAKTHTLRACADKEVKDSYSSCFCDKTMGHVPPHECFQHAHRWHDPPSQLELITAERDALRAALEALLVRTETMLDPSRVEPPELALARQALQK